jgi:anti-anti-sigma factor
MPHNVGIQVDSDNTCSVVHVDGDIDWETSSQVRTAILEVMNGCEDRVVVDLKGVKRIDTVGASVLVRAFDDAEERKIDFLLTGLN